MKEDINKLKNIAERDEKIKKTSATITGILVTAIIALLIVIPMISNFSKAERTSENSKVSEFTSSDFTTEYCHKGLTYTTNISLNEKASFALSDFIDASERLFANSECNIVAMSFSDKSFKYLQAEWTKEHFNKLKNDNIRSDKMGEILSSENVVKPFSHDLSVEKLGYVEIK